MDTGEDLTDLQRLVKDHAVDGMIVVEGIQPEAYQWIKKNVRAVVGIDISDHEVPAIPAMRAVAEQHLRIPEDIAFFGVDNIELSQFTSPQGEQSYF